MDPRGVRGLVKGVDAARLARYADKLRHVEQRLDQFGSWAGDAVESDRDRLASFKAFQEVGEALADVCAMLVKDLGIGPKDDYTNVDVLETEDVLDGTQANALRELNGLRNRLVHEYDDLDESLAVESALELAPSIRLICKELRTWISDNA